MALTVEVKEGGNYKPAPAGQFQAVCCELVDLGHRKVVYKNKDTGADEPKTIHEIQYIFQINKVDDESGKRFTVRSRPFNLILSENSNLRAFLLGWRGHDITDAEMAPPGVDVDLVGRNAILSVVHNKVGDKNYANIGSIMPLMEGMPEIQALDYEPQAEAIKNNRAKSAAASAGAGSAPQAAAPQTDAVPTANGNDDIPF
jgi:hypothetical protein